MEDDDTEISISDVYSTLGFLIKFNVRILVDLKLEFSEISKLLKPMNKYFKEIESILSPVDILMIHLNDLSKELHQKYNFDMKLLVPSMEVFKREINDN